MSIRLLRLGRPAGPIRGFTEYLDEMVRFQVPGMESGVWLVGVSLGRVVFGGEGGDGFGAWLGVSGEGSGVLVSAFGLEAYGGDSFLA